MSASMTNAVALDAPHPLRSDRFEHAGFATLVGIAAGGALAVVATRAMGSFLVGVSPTDALAFFGSAAVVIGAAAISSYLPARRAAKVAPGSALRAD